MKTTTTTTALRLLAVLFIFCLFAPMAAGQDVPTPPTYWEGNVDKIANAGDGTGESWKSPILIASAEELAYLAKQVNAKGNLTVAKGVAGGSIENKDDHIGFKGIYFALSADIDLEKHYWTPIGIGSNPFNGNFDGQGHCVSGLKVNVNGNNNVYAGLFGRAYIGTIQNLGVCVAKEGIRGAVNEGSIYAGGIASSAQNVHNCYVVGEGSIEINVGSVGFAEIFVYAGGIVGDLSNSGSLTNCYATVDIRIETNGERYAGGIVGFCNSNSTISYTYATGDIETGTGEKEYYAGGICGYLKGSTNNTTSTIKNSLALNGRITGGDNKSNRIVGKKETEATLTTNYASPEIVVNGNTVSDGTGSNENGDPSITFNNFQDKLKVEWEAAWTFSSDGYLPQLMLNNGDGTYTDWPEASPQPFIDAVASLPGSIANADGRDGSGWNKAILIANRAELAYFAQQVNKGDAINYGSGNDQIEPGGNYFAGIYFALSADIDLKDHYWTPIGTEDNPFKGNFDGQGHCVSGLKVNVNGNYNVYAGLFGRAYIGTIQNLGVCLAKEGVRATNTNIMVGNIYAGGIAGYAQNIHNCNVVGEGCIKINGEANGYAGGIVGYLFDSGSLTNCYATVDIRIETKGECHAGGIVGFCNYNSTISCTYATGDVETGTGGNLYYAGGICGYLNGSSTIENSLALNGRITGGDNKSNRIVGHKDETSTTNYASPVILVNDKTSLDNQVDNENGANTWLSSFEADLKNAPAGSTNDWSKSWTFTPGNLPQLKKKTEGGYEEWTSKQPELKANLYLPSRLHIVSSTGGTLTVTDEAGNLLTDGSVVLSGTVLTLAKTKESGYVFDAYLVSSDGSNFTDYINGTIVMPDHDLYLSARFKEEQKLEPEPPYVPPTPIYYSVYLPQVEGASTDPGPGEYEVESWDDFRFYLTLDSAYSDSQPVVTTDRGETLEPRSSDGAYLVKYVRTDVEVFIDGLIQNPPPVANEAIGTDALAPQIWAEGSMLCIRMPEALPSAPIRIFTADGRLYDSFNSTPGLSRRQLPTGVYIVRVGDTACKVIIK